MYKAKITVTLRKSILDPQGKAVLHGAHSIGYSPVRDIRIGKFIEMNIDAPDEEQARTVCKDVCQKLLSNPVMEDYQFTVERSA